MFKWKYRNIIFRLEKIIRPRAPVIAPGRDRAGEGLNVTSTGLWDGS